jgi:CheY-like chemotaxis protein
LESLSTLAGGIAHDFNNLLTTVLSNLSLATSQLGSEDPLGQKLKEAERACLQTRGLTYQLLTFSKGGAPVRKVMSLTPLVKEAARFALVGSNASCEFLLPEDLWPANIDETQIGQVIHNLLLNADQAMPRGGKIRIEAQNVTIRGHPLLPLSDGRYVTVSIRDEGLGIPPDRLPRIFDPFFTTKPSASGLGLSTSYSILKNHGGYLTVTSEMDKGSTFTFYLPASSQGEEERGEEGKPQKEVPVRGKGRILVMDDQEGVRVAAKHALSHLGYEPTLAKNGAEAIQLYREAWESGRPFAAVIMDLTVPTGMGGHEALQHMVQINPQVKAIVCSGYAQDPTLSRYRQYGFLGVLSKPYRIEEMGRILQEVIEGKRGGTA